MENVRREIALSGLLLQGHAMTVIAFYNIKGGVGKTASCVNLAYLAAAERSRTLLCDLDPQGSASFYFRIQPLPNYSGQKLLKGGKRIEKNIRGTDFDYLDLLPADMSYRNLDIMLDGKKRAHKRLKEVLMPFEDDYTYILLDCPPNITLLSENILYAADFIFVPLIPTVLSVQTFAKLREFMIASKYSVDKLYPFFSMVEKRKRIHLQYLRSAQLKKNKVLRWGIPYSTEIEKMGLHRQPLTFYKPACLSAKYYQALWREMKTIMHHL